MARYRDGIYTGVRGKRKRDRARKHGHIDRIYDRAVDRRRGD